MIKSAFVKPQFLHIVLIIFLGLIVYSASWKAGFIWDDYYFIRDNSFIKDWSNIQDVFKGRISENPSFLIYVYRPLQVLSYFIDYSLWELNPFGYHFTNTLLHILVAILLYWFITVLYGNLQLSFLAALLFVAHPVNSQAVTYISARADLLAAAAVILCLIFYSKASQKKQIGTCAAVILCSIIAVLSKENALILPLLLLLYNFVFKKKVNFFPFLSVVVTVLLYLVLRSAKLSSFSPGIDVMVRRIPGFLAAITGYFSILIFPFGLYMDHGSRFFALGEPEVISGILILFSILAFLILKRKDKKILFSILWFFICLLPTTSIYPVLPFYMTDSWLYLPSVGFFVVLANAIYFTFQDQKAKRLGAVLFAALIFLFSVLTVSQIKNWQNEIEFYKRNLIFNPSSTDCYNNLGVAYRNKGSIGQAIWCHKRAMKLEPGQALPYYLLGTDYAMVSMHEAAIKEFEAALRLKADYFDAYLGLSRSFGALGKFEESVKFCQKALELSPKDPTLYFLLGSAYYDSGNKEASIRAMSKAIEIQPDYVEAYNNLASTYSELGQVDKAIESWEKALRIKPDAQPVHLNLAKFYYIQGKYELANKHCLKLIELGFKLDPKFIESVKSHLK